MKLRGLKKSIITFISRHCLSLRLENKNKLNTQHKPTANVLIHITTQHFFYLCRRNIFFHELGLLSISWKMYFYKHAFFKVKICSNVTEKSEVPGDGGGFSRIGLSANDFSSYHGNNKEETVCSELLYLKHTEQC